MRLLPKTFYTIQNIPGMWNTELVKYLVSKELNVNHRDNEGNTAVRFCRNLEVLKCLVQLGIDISPKNKRGQTVLHIVAVCGPKDIKSIFEYLLFRELNTRDQYQNGKTPLDYCMSKQDRKVLIPLSNIWG